MAQSKFEESSVWNDYVAKMNPRVKTADEFEPTNPQVAQPGSKPPSNQWYGLTPGKTTDEILDEAHPDPIIAGPSYDRLNGLVENLKERSNVMSQIALQVHHPRQTGHAYVLATKELLEETIKLGYLLEAENQEALADLADACSEKLASLAEDQLKKEALVWFAYPLIVAGLAGIGALVAGGHINNNPQSRGLLNDINYAVDQLNDVLEDSDYSKAHAAVRSFKESLVGVKSNIIELSASMDSIDKDLVDIKSKDIKEKGDIVVGILNDLFIDGKDKKIEELVNTTKEQINTVLKGIPDLDRIMDKTIKEFRGGQSAFWAGLKNFWNENLINNNIQDAIKADEVLSSSLGDYMSTLDDVVIHLDELRKLTQEFKHSVPKKNISNEISSEPGTQTPADIAAQYNQKYQ